VPHTKLKRGSLATRAGHGALLHAVAHIEFNAIKDGYKRYFGLLRSDLKTSVFSSQP
jgi:uncharacterized ferritin-like protein (DUF455 family)